jgi:hypothetical protein
MRYKIFRIVENFFGCKGQERGKRSIFQAALYGMTKIFLFCVASPHYFSPPFLALRSRAGTKL